MELDEANDGLYTMGGQDLPDYGYLVPLALVRWDFDEEPMEELLPCLQDIIVRQQYNISCVLIASVNSVRMYSFFSHHVDKESANLARLARMKEAFDNNLPTDVIDLIDTMIPLE